MRLASPEATPLDLTFRLFGTDVRVHPFFWLITVLMADWILKLDDWAPMLMAWVLAVFVSILLHEFGHVWMWRAFGVEARILLHGMGGLAIANDDAPRRWQRVLVSFAGPLIQLVLWAALYFTLPQSGRSPGQYPALSFFLVSMLWINLVWPIINLLPIYPLDGGQIARETFQMAATRSRTVNSRPALVASLWLSIGTAAAVAFYILMPNFNISQPYPLPVGPFTAVMCVLLAVANFQELQQMRGRRGPLDDDW